MVFEVLFFLYVVSFCAFQYFELNIFLFVGFLNFNSNIGIIKKIKGKNNSKKCSLIHQLF